jgi:hypothetical protein
MSSARSAGASRATAPGSLAPNVLARAAALERAGDLRGALAAYEDCAGLAPDNPDILAALAAFATRIEIFDVAVKLWEQVSLVDPQRLDAIEGCARAWRELGAFERAIALLRAAILDHPEDARLWNSLGVTLMQDSQAGLAIVFFDEAIRLDGRYAAALHNRGNARFDLGELEVAAADFEQARKVARKPAEIAAIGFAAATLALARGDLAAGWEAYEARFSRNLGKAMVFDTPGRRWTPDQALAGRHLLVLGEQGLGDEFMFANLVPDVMDALGPDGRLTLAVEPRLVDLFRRSFPAAAVTRHVTDRTGPRPRRAAADLDERRAVDLWAPMGSLPRHFRRTHADFPSTRAYLRPDPARVAHWRNWLGPGPPAVGISWRSGKMLGDRRRQYPPPDLWAPILALPGVRFVNVQYGDCAEELARFRVESGCEILEPPGLDIREDIDDLAALCVALDLMLCVGNATGALAGACGAPVAIISPPAAWPRLGTEGFPWYPAARALTPPAYGDWAPAMAQAAGLVRGLPRSEGATG